MFYNSINLLFILLINNNFKIIYNLPFLYKIVYFSNNLMIKILFLKNK